MNEQRMLQRVMPQLQRIIPQLRLDVPTTPTALRRQLEQLQSVLEQLDFLQDQVNWTFSGQREKSVSPAYFFLRDLMDLMEDCAVNLSLLAEEFPADQPGTLSCLRSLEQNLYKIQVQLQVIESLNQLPEPESA